MRLSYRISEAVFKQSINKSNAKKFKEANSLVNQAI